MTPRYESWYWTCSQISLFVLQCHFNVDYLFGNSIFASCQVPDKYDQYDNNTDITVTGIKDGSNTTPTSYHISTWFVQSYTTSYKRPQGTRCSQRRCASVLMVVKCNHHKASAIRHWGCLATFTPLMSTEAITCSVCPCSQSYWVLFFFSTDGENTMKNIVYHTGKNIPGS